MRTQREIDAALFALGWRLDGPTQTFCGWKAITQRGAASMLVAGPTPELVLEYLLVGAEARVRGQP